MLTMNPALTDADCNAALRLFDADGTGEITRHEFIKGVELMKTFD